MARDPLLSAIVFNDTGIYLLSLLIVLALAWLLAQSVVMAVGGRERRRWPRPPRRARRQPGPPPAQPRRSPLDRGPPPLADAAAPRRRRVPLVRPPAGAGCGATRTTPTPGSRRGGSTGSTWRSLVGFVLVAFFFRLWRLDTAAPHALRRGLPRAVRHRVARRLAGGLDARHLRVDPPAAGQVPDRGRHRLRGSEQGGRRDRSRRPGHRPRRRAAADRLRPPRLDRLHLRRERQDRGARGAEREAGLAPGTRPATSPAWPTTRTATGCWWGSPTAGRSRSTTWRPSSASSASAGRRPASRSSRPAWPA